MKNTILLTFVLFLFINVTNSQWLSNPFTPNSLVSIRMVDQNNGYVLADNGGLWNSSNGGLCWTFKSNVGYTEMYEMYWLNINTGFAVHGLTLGPGRIIKTTNSGSTWTVVNTQNSAGFQGITFLNACHGIACGATSLIKYTTDCGNNWVYVPAPTTTQVYTSVFFVDSLIGCIVGANSTGLNSVIVRTSNGGYNWSVAGNFPSLGFLYSVFFPSHDIGYAVGDYLNNNETTVILKTTNSGLNWSQIFYNTTFGAPRSVYFINNNIGWIVGRYGMIKVTTDGGVSWNTQISNTTQTLMSVRFANLSIGYIVGQNGVSLYTPDRGGCDIIVTGLNNNEIKYPDSYSILQNYPNPFNPKTKIKFQIPKNSYVKLTIYDILGHEVFSLDNNYLKTGVYEYYWDASYYSSGIYFYKLDAGDFVETKKMVLIK